MNEHEPVDMPEDELHAYADGQLTAERARFVDAWLARNPQAAAEIDAWKAQNDQIRALFGRPIPGSPTLPIATTGRGRGTGRIAQLAAACAILAVGIGIGMAASRLATAPVPALTVLDALPRDARTNYLVYAGEVRHPVEVRADERDHLVTWLSKRLGSDLPAPDLGAQGFTLVGGRLVSFSGGPGALLMYEDARGTRLTLLAGRNADNGETGFLFDRKDDVATFYWIDGPLGYAISGVVDRPVLEAVAHAVYEQL